MRPHFFTSDLIFRVRPVFQVWPFIKLKFLSSVTYFFQLWFIFSSVTHFFKYRPYFLSVSYFSKCDLLFSSFASFFPSVSYFYKCEIFFKWWPLSASVTHVVNFDPLWKRDPFLKVWPISQRVIVFCNWPIFHSFSTTGLYGGSYTAKWSGKHCCL